MRWEETSRWTRIWVLGSFSGRPDGDGRVRRGGGVVRGVVAMVRVRVGWARRGRRDDGVVRVVVAADARTRGPARRRIAGRIMA